MFEPRPENYPAKPWLESHCCCLALVFVRWWHYAAPADYWRRARTKGKKVIWDTPRRGPSTTTESPSPIIQPALIVFLIPDVR